MAAESLFDMSICQHMKSICFVRSKSKARRSHFGNVVCLIFAFGDNSNCVLRTFSSCIRILLKLRYQLKIVDYDNYLVSVFKKKLFKFSYVFIKN